MKEIERYKITSANGNSSNVTKCDDGHWVNYADVEKLQAQIKELESIADQIKDHADEQVIDETVAIPISILSDINLYYEKFYGDEHD